MLEIHLLIINVNKIKVADSIVHHCYNSTSLVYILANFCISIKEKTFSLFVSISSLRTEYKEQVCCRASFKQNTLQKLK